MTLSGMILKKVKSHNSMMKKYSSPPPETEDVVVTKKKIKNVDKFWHVVPCVSTLPPALQQSRRMFVELSRRHQLFQAQYAQNFLLLAAIRRQQLLGGGVDIRWDRELVPCTQHLHRRETFLRRVCKDNRLIYKTIKNAKAKVTTTESLRRDWAKNRQKIISGAARKFVLFEPEPKEQIEDIAFMPPADCKRQRVRLELGVAGGAALGALRVELFAECPRTAALFLQLLDGDARGHGYVGTRFFTKVPGLLWSGGDVIYDNGCGCYAQPGRRVPIGAENYHFSHSMPGLLSMKVSKDDEMCGIFNITFKALPQLDLKSVVFGRVIRPCSTYECLRLLGAALSPRPVVVIRGASRLDSGKLIRGLPNTRIIREQKILNRLG